MLNDAIFTLCPRWHLAPSRRVAQAVGCTCFWQLISLSKPLFTAVFANYIITVNTTSFYRYIVCRSLGICPEWCRTWECCINEGWYHELRYFLKVRQCNGEDDMKGKEKKCWSVSKVKVLLLLFANTSYQLYISNNETLWQPMRLPSSVNNDYMVQVPLYKI